MTSNRRLLLDSSGVCQVSITRVLQESAYMLFYLREGEGRWVITV